MNRSKLMWSLGLLVAIFVSLCAGRAGAVEKLKRGVLVIARPDGSVYVGWRLLKSDPRDAAFEVRRREPGENRTHQLNSRPITRSTNFVDHTATEGKTYLYSVRLAGGIPSREARLTAPPKDAAYISIPFRGKYVAQKVAIADLDGDGALDYVIKQPNFNVDPYQREGYWKKSRDTYKIEAYRSDGKFLWRYDMGWAIEEGIWYSPYVVYDLDGDGRAEVYTKAGMGDPRDEKGLVQTGPEWLVKLDGLTGEIVNKIPWPSREGFAKYNYYCRNFLAIAYLDGKNPSLIVQRGTYGLTKMLAYNNALNLLWRWEAAGPDKAYRGQGSHGFNAADVDGDGRDELIYGSACIDEYGHPLWNTGKGHPDFVYVADVDPERPGLEIFYGIERRSKKGAVCLVDARTGQIIWENPEPTRHIHGQGLCADIDPEHRGMECYGKERDSDDSWLYSAKGERLGDKPIGGTTPRAVWWDGTPHKSLVIRGRIHRYKGETQGKIEGRIIGIADCLGDWREEIITSVPGELRIYTTTIPATTRRTCLMQDRQYRTQAAVESMGYYYPPQLGLEEGVTAAANKAR